jgi:hypothetical protein
MEAGKGLTSPAQVWTGGWNEDLPTLNRLSRAPAFASSRAQANLSVAETGDDFELASKSSHPSSYDGSGPTLFSDLRMGLSKSYEPRV